jgi:hypothetical protein
MVPAHAARRSQASRRKLATLVHQALHDLSELHDYAHQLRSHPEHFAQADFSPRELDALIAAVREGHRALLQHRAEWGHSPAEILPELSRSADHRFEPEATAPARLIVTYKRCSRHLGLALQEARDVHVRALSLGEVVYRLLRDLEKQLWLLNAPPEKPTQGFAMVGLFQAC